MVFNRPKSSKGDDAQVEASTSFRPVNPRHRVVMMEDLDYRIFEIDPSIQRDEDPIDIKNIVDDFDEEALGTFTISIRVPEDPHDKARQWILVDGQQRRAALNQLQWPGRVRAVVHYGLTPAQEAQLFLRLNKRRNIGPAGRYKARLKANEAQAVAIRDMLEQLQIPWGGPNGFSAIQRADRIYAKATGPADLAWALEILRDTYHQYDGRVLEALAMIHAAFAQYLNTANMRKKLNREHANIDVLIGQGKVAQHMYHCPIAMALTEPIIAAYNTYTRDDSKTSSRLPSLLHNRKQRSTSRTDKKKLAAAQAVAAEAEGGTAN